jgi:uncharacterized RDD family membrane protein YckC
VASSRPPFDEPYPWQETAPDPLDHPEFYDGVIPRRIFAHYIDLCFIFFFIALISLFLVILGVLSFGLLFIPLAVAAIVIAIAYDALQVGGPHAATIGMRLMGLEVRSWSGGPPLRPQAWLRSILFWVLIYGFNLLTFWIALGWALFDRRRRCLHDFLAGTVVVRAKKVMVFNPGTSSNMR